jgi:hypothetical protein
MNGGPKKRKATNKLMFGRKKKNFDVPAAMMADASPEELDAWSRDAVHNLRENETAIFSANLIEYQQREIAKLRQQLTSQAAISQRTVARQAAIFRELKEKEAIQKEQYETLVERL